MISARTTAALQAAKARGVTLGTPNHTRIARSAAKGNRASAQVRSEASRRRAATSCQSLMRFGLLV